jgi:hypothetical protein
MVSSSTGDNNSDLWISLDDAVSYTGVSRRSIQEWIRTGQVKREKRKGQIFVWVADLAGLTPLTRPEPEEESPKAEVLSPSYSDGYTSAASLKAVGERLKENFLIQEKILNRLDEVQNAVVKANERSVEPVLDERTVKELSLLGNVFRSIHQQNEKVGKALDQQESLLRKMESNIDREDSWTQRWLGSERRLGRWRLLTITFLVLGMAIALLGWQEFTRQMEKWELQVRQSQQENKETIELLAEKNKILLLKEKEIQQLDRDSKLRLAEETAKLEQKFVREMQERESALQKEISDKEMLLALLKEKEEQHLKQLESMHSQELSRMTANQSQTISALSESIAALKEQMKQLADK